jgi:hypothetical protein
MRNNAPGSDADARPNSDAVVSPVATHWTRILYCDLYAGCTTDGTTDPGERRAGDLPSPTAGFITTRRHEEDKEVSVKTTDSSHDAASDRKGSSIQGAAILVTICILAYLAIGGILQVMSLDAAAAAPDGALTPLAAVTASNPPVGEAQALSTNASDQGSEPADSTRECGQKANNYLCD